MKNWEDLYEGDFSNIYSPCCRNGIVQWDGNNYRCSCCKRIIDRSDFFDLIGGSYGPECISCDEMFPWCENCKWGHQGYEVIED